MIRQCVAVMLVGALLGLCSPVMAGDFVSPRFRTPAAGSGIGLDIRNIPSTTSGLPALGTRVGLPSSYAAFYPSPSPQQTGAPSSGRHWSKAGKILTFIGAGFVVAGAVMIPHNNQTISSSCNSSSCTDLQINWKATGAATLGTGAVLMIIGLTRRTTD